MLYLTIIGGAFIAWLILALLFTPHIPYHIEADLDATSDHFVHVLESTCLSTLTHGNRVEILTNGDRFYPAMLDAIRRRARDDQHGVLHLQEREIGDQFIEALANGRAPASASRWSWMPLAASARSGKAPVRCAKPAAASSLPEITWYRLSRLNNRTHRELLVVDGARRVRRRRRCRRLVGRADAGQADVARHDGARSKVRSSSQIQGMSPRTGSSAAAKS